MIVIILLELIFLWAYFIVELLVGIGKVLMVVQCRDALLMGMVYQVLVDVGGC